MITGTHAELWLVDHINGDILIGNVFVLYEHLPLELIYSLSVTMSGIYIRKQECGWQWDNPKIEQAFFAFLLEIRLRGEEIFLDICDPGPDLPGYPATDYHPVYC